MAYELHIESDGPLFDGKMEDDLKDVAEDVYLALAERGAEIVRAKLHPQLRHPTGFYESRLIGEVVNGVATVHDQGVVYGPWLAGVGSRNSTSSFKGYDHWVKASAALAEEASDISNGVIVKLVDEWNG
jgi:hypothetical protein